MKYSKNPEKSSARFARREFPIITSACPGFPRNFSELPCIVPKFSGAGGEGGMAPRKPEVWDPHLWARPAVGGGEGGGGGGRPPP